MPKHVKLIVISGISIILIVALFVGGFVYSLSYDPYKDLKCETNTILTTVVYGTLYIGEDKVQLSKICREHKDNYVLYDTLCVYENKAYIVCTRTGSDGIWTVATIDLKTEDFEGKYDFAAISWYDDDREEDFSLRSGYYHDGKIVLNDSVNVAEYDIKSGESTIIPFDEYCFYSPGIQWSFPDDYTISITEKEEVKSFTLKTMAKFSKAIAKLYSFKDKKIWCDSYYVSEAIVYSNVQVVNEQVYLIRSILNYVGESFAVILEYKNGVWNYACHYYSGDSAVRAYVVETVN